jgi:hypothetical protein
LNRALAPLTLERRALQVSDSNPRTRLVKEKYFSLRLKPLEHWLWQQGVSQAAERVFWLHWEEGMRAKDWCSQIPLRGVAQQCCIDSSTVTRAYQTLKSLGLIRREDPGRDPVNPFQQATAITEVLIPRALLAELHRSPNRRQINKLVGSEPIVDPMAQSALKSAVAISMHPVKGSRALSSIPTRS